ncbi:hypothetical protein NS383_03895 [Pseudomonas oryzihabitans]|nr:hypothetical protein NS383_03895 [Pseudomonas psychrotolerans]
MRYGHEIPGFRWHNRRELFAHALGEGGLAADEHRDVGAQAQAQDRQVIQTGAEAPKMVQAEQGGGGVRTAAADPATHGQALGQPEVGALRSTAFLLQQAGGAQDEILFWGDARQAVVQVQ